jgi:hypothetical protein
MGDSSPLCACCLHPESSHCKGDVTHSTYKDQARMIPNPITARCKSRHCTSPICCCLEFAATAADVKWPNVPAASA